MTNDGNAILREVLFKVSWVVCSGCALVKCFITDLFQIQVQHPAAKSMIEISRTQDEEVGDGTTSVIILGKWYCLSFVTLKQLNLLKSIPDQDPCYFSMFCRRTALMFTILRHYDRRITS